MASAKVEVEKNQKLDVRQATKAAMAYFHELFPHVLQFSLEEVEKSEDGKYWLITLGYDEEKPKTPPIVPVSPSIQDLFNPTKMRMRYKLFKVDIRTGEVVAMKIRSI